MIRNIVGLTAVMGLFAGPVFGEPFACKMVVRDGISYRANILAQPTEAVPAGASRTLHAAGYRAVVNLGAREDGNAYVEVGYDVEGSPALSYQFSPMGLSRYRHGSIDRQKKRHITVECSKSE
ncbi:hypothetical protein [Candidatus Entotheonella palauensis]|uniref:Uncharacterized protein n=1 Tax=Candidatus Entotheonella gemina TaxID=1429439 RepID=W4M133_9BACT|nr:hypothetical protein [Candidatus Entotheonella palauensis]ETX03828.1 MAG: hypothetical protein ETSY2_32365 [Candidatus Entotheonella gemina]